MRRLAAILFLAFGLSGCGGKPPAALAGLWSAGPAACEAGVGLRFDADAVRATYAGDRQILFANPRYRVLSAQEPMRLEIRYDLPGDHLGARGVMVLERRNDGWLTPVSHQFRDTLTGAVRMPLGQDQLGLALTVRPCAPNAWIAGLRGRAEAN